MSAWRLLPALILGWLCGLSAGHAAEKALTVLDAPVAYTANFSVSGPKGQYQGQVWHMPGMERRDYATRGGSQAILLRRDQNAAYLLNPDRRWYVGLGFDAVLALGGDLQDLTVERTVVNEESVAGIKARHERLHATGSHGQSFDGEGWFSKEGICLRIRGTMTDRGQVSSPVETSLTNVRLGRVDSSQFDLPKGWFGLDLKTIPPDKIVPALEKMRPMLEGR